MPQWIHGRAEHILAKNPSMPKGEAFAIATQQAHAVGKSPKGFGTSQGRNTAKSKYNTPSDDKKSSNPGHLTSPKMEKKGMDSIQLQAFYSELEKISGLNLTGIANKSAPVIPTPTIAHQALGIGKGPGSMPQNRAVGGTTSSQGI